VVDSAGKFIGVLEINDLVSWIVHFVYKKYSINHEEQRERIEAISKIVMKPSDLDGFVHKFEHFPIEAIIDRTTEVTSCVVSANTSVLSAVTLLTSHFGPSPVQRLVVVDENQNIVNYVSKSALLKFFMKNSSLYHEIASTPLKSLNLGIVDVAAVCHHPSKTTLVASLALLHEYRLNSVALLDEHDSQHTPLTVLSVSDVGGLVRDPRRLSETVGDYIRTVRMESSSQLSHPFIAINTETSLGSTIEKICSVHLHQLYILRNNKNEPSPRPTIIVGVCTLDSLLACLKAHISP